MNASILQEFRAMQLAIKGAYRRAFDDVKELYIEGIDAIELGDNALITAIHLDKDIVNINLFDYNSYAPISNFSEEIIEEIVDTMRAKALDICNRDVMVNCKGELSKDTWRF